MRYVKLLKKQNISNYLYILIYIFIGIIIVLNIRGNIPSFDGAMNVQVAENLLDNGLYASNYPKGLLFDEKIETGITVNLPIAIIIKVFGRKLGSAVAINWIYIIILLIVVVKLFDILRIKRYWSLIVLSLFLATPFFFEYGMSLYGEIPTLVWIILSIICLEKSKADNSKYFIFSGISYGLAYLTKTVALIGVPAFLLVFLYRSLIKKDLKIQTVIIWIIGVLSPIAIFELYKLTQLGYYEYINWWEDSLSNILKQAGVKKGFEDTNNIFTKFIVHLKLFASYFNINIFAFIGILICNFIVLCKRILKDKNFRYLDILFLIGFFYFGWWLIITTTEKAWARRIIIGVLVMEVTTIYNCRYILQHYNIMKFKDVWKVTASIVFSLIVLIVSNSNIINKSNEAIKEKDSIKTISKTINSIDSSALVCGFGWWQAPVIAFESGKDFGNYYQLKDKNMVRDIYLVVDKYAKMNAQDELDQILSEADYTTVYEDNVYNNYIYKITEVLPYKKFTEEDFNSVTQNSLKMDEDYAFVRGIYDYEKEPPIRWSQKNSAVLLKNNLDTNKVKLNVSYQILDYEKYDEKPVMKIYIDDKEVYSKNIEQNGIYNEIIDINDKATKGDVVKINFKFNSKIVTESDARELAFILREVSLE